MKKIIIGIVIVFVVISVGIWTGKIKFPNTTPSSEINTTSATVEEVSITEKKVVEQKGRVLYTLSIPEIADLPLLQKNINDYVEGFKNGIAKSAEEINFDGASSTYSLNISYDIIRNDKELVVIKMSASEYTGGAHGNPSFAFFMYDVRAKRMIGEDEILVSKTDAQLFTIVAQALLAKPQYIFQDEGRTKSMFFDADENRLTFIANLSTSGNIALSKNGVLFKYGAYAIGPYVIGEPEVEIAFKDIEPFLTPYAKTFFK